MDPIGRTSLLVAAMRAAETERSDAQGRLCEDPFARALAGPEGFEVLRQTETPVSELMPVIALRTYHHDEHFLAALARGVHQVVILAAGMDARAFRLPFPAGVRLFEVEREEVLALKEARLAGAPPRAWRRVVPMDLAGDWPAALTAAGMDPAVPSLWLVEGLLLYLDEAAVETLFRRLDALAAPGSALLFDVMGRVLLRSPMMAERRETMARMGAPWLFGMDDPVAFMARFGWEATATEPGQVAPELKRWPYPVAPRSVPGVPRSFFVEARKVTR